MIEYLGSHRQVTCFSSVSLIGLSSPLGVPAVALLNGSEWRADRLLYCADGQETARRNFTTTRLQKAVTPGKGAR
jgi:hypothetical protein